MSWTRSVVTLALFAALTPLGAQQSPGATRTRKPAAGAAAGSTKYFRLHWAKLIDQYGFAQPMEAARILTPTDWKFEGVVQWSAANGCPPNMVKTIGGAMSPDSLSGFQFFPNHTWQWFDNPQQQQATAALHGQSSVRTGCGASPLVGAVDYIQQSILPQFRPNAHIVTTEPMPKLTQSLQAEAQGQSAEGSVRVDAGRVKIAYEIDGHPVEEWIMAAVKVIARPGLGGRGYWYNATAGRIFAYRTPAGKLESEPALFATMLGSIRNNPQWTAKMTQVLTNTNKIDENGTIARNNIRADMQQNQTDEINGRYQQISDAEDKQSEEFAQTQRGLEWYTDPTTHERVEMSYGYRHSWTNSNGEYILSDDPNFNPEKVFNGTWTPLERQQQ